MDDFRVVDEKDELTEAEWYQLDFIIWQYAPTLPDNVHAELLERLGRFTQQVYSRAHLLGFNEGIKHAYEEPESKDTSPEND